MNDRPLVSIIMPAYNSSRFIEQAIQSVLHQTYTNWELLVIDDASRDTTVKIVQECAAASSKIKLLISSENQGAGVARNKGIKAATGTYIAFLDADDLWFPEKLSIQLKFMQERGLQMTFSSYELISESGEKLHKMVEALPLLSYNKLLRSNYVGNLTGIYSVEILGKIYNASIRKRQDWALWLSVLKETGNVEGITAPLAYYRIRRESISNNKLSLLKHNFNVYYKVLNFGILKSCAYMILFLWEHFMLKSKQLKQLDH
ncbi:glycosyltransferase [Gillisia sp. M10.2A]|uniref:Glycosyltransferase n=1 Tax=Gillisia lutea TaxID=2909668 RepID=A0ABS9EEG9_9FLAO|nr:glycosyltransferase family 2 protein [Gillisia lutea]MCF4100657.1 glycosyltransferase [Gillisia lutea]